MNNVDMIEYNLKSISTADATKVLAMMELVESVSKLNTTLQSIEEHMRYSR